MYNMQAKKDVDVDWMLRVSSTLARDQWTVSAFYRRRRDAQIYNNSPPSALDPLL